MVIIEPLPRADYCEPLIWHLTEARDSAVAAKLPRTVQAIELVMAIVMGEYRSACARPRLRVVG